MSSTAENFVHLRVHTAYSLAEGALPVKKLVGLCVKHNMPAAAMTDTGNMFGALEYAVAAKGDGVQPILGTHIALLPPDWEMDPSRPGLQPKMDRLVLIAATRAGYFNLLSLVSKAHMETEPGRTPHITMADLEGQTDGVICLAGGLDSPVGRLAADGQTQRAEQEMLALQFLFSDRLYAEITRMGYPGELAAEKAVLDMAYQHNIPLVATNPVFFIDRKMHEAHDALLCIAGGAYIIQDDRRRISPEHYFKTAQQMRELFADIPEACDNTLAIAQRCNWLLEKIDPILPPFDCGEGRNETDELRHQSEVGLEERLKIHVYPLCETDEEREEKRKEYADRLNFELGIIEGMGFPGYFLIVSDFIKWAKEHDIPVGPGRGSGAGSLVAWALLITDLDPIRWGLLFERFLNPERVSMPDFDVDFCQERREEVIRYVQQKYGRDRVAQIITFGKLQAKAVVRDVGRVLQMPYGQVDRLSKLIPNNPANPPSLAEALQMEPELRAEQRREESVARLIEIAQQIEGLYRNSSTHAAGVVIGDRPLTELIPLYRDPRSDMPVTQFNMKYVEDAGLVKFDFLGLKTLDVLQRCVELLKPRGIDIDLAALPLDDAPTFEMMARGETTGVFQVESQGMRDVLRQMGISKFEEIIALVSLYRPGPMDNIPTYIAVKKGQEEPDYMHPLLQPILEETYGIMIYQEQVQLAARVLSGYTLGGADLLRRAMGKKIQSEMDKERVKFVEGAKEHNDVSEELSGHIFDQIAKFAGYGFNKSHAAAYALISYQTAYLKANYPVEFMAASMTLDLDNTDKLGFFKREVDRLEIPLLGPDVNKSDTRFTVEKTAHGDYAIRYALAAVKGVGDAAMDEVVKEREANGPYTDLYDFFERMGATKVLNKRLIENLCRAGSFDSLEPNRRKVMESIEVLMRHAQAVAAEKESAQVSMFGGADGGTELPKPRLAEPRPWDNEDTLAEEFAAVGFYLSAHPLDAYGPTLARLNIVPFADLAAGGDKVAKIAGIVSVRREKISQKGNKFAFVELSDASGAYEVTMFSEVLALGRPHLDPGCAVVMNVTVERDATQEGGGDVRLLAQSVQPLDEVAAGGVQGVVIELDADANAEQLAAELEVAGQGRAAVTILAPTHDGQEARISLSRRYAIRPSVRKALRNLDGVRDVVDA